MKHKKFDFRTAYIDVLLNVLTGIIFLFILTTLMIQPQKKQDEGMKKNAQYVMNVEWESNTDCDVDVWVQDPQNNIVYFQQRDKGVMHLERDDLGFRNDIVSVVPGNTINVIENRETWVLRGIIPGIYTVNLHLYGCRVDGIAVLLNQDFVVPVTVELFRINPKYTLVTKKEITMNKIWEEATVMNFQLDADGNVIGITNNYKQLVKSKEP